jgi:hypothetical protein
MQACLFEQEMHDIENFRCKEFYSKGCSPRKIQQEFALGSISRRQVVSVFAAFYVLSLLLRQAFAHNITGRTLHSIVQIES